MKATDLHQGNIVGIKIPDYNTTAHPNGTTTSINAGTFTIIECEVDNVWHEDDCDMYTPFGRMEEEFGGAFVFLKRTIGGRPCTERVPFSEIIPIEISEEILTNKLGFTKTVSCWKMIRGEFGEGDSIEVAWNDVGKWYVGFRNFNNGKDDDYVFLKDDLKYVHELQNIMSSIENKLTDQIEK